MSTNSTGRFVVQKHNASRLHYDFRLELDGVLKSWAVPKEPQTEAGIKRLAIEVGDHEISYIDFEGTIPEGKYGAGTVEIWDSGYYELEERTPDKILFILHGKKMHGKYTLIHVPRFKDSDWLLFKSKNQDVT